MLMNMVGLSACTTDNLNTSDTSAPDRPEKMYEDVAVEDFKQVNISGDLNPAHTYTVRCDKDGETLNIELMMENPENDNDVLGSPMIDIPQREFEKIEISEVL